MKLFALLIFSFELVASTIILPVPNSEEIPQSGKFNIEIMHNHGLNQLSSLFCEETGEEERETKGEPILDFVELFSLAERFSDVEIESHLIKVAHSVIRFSSQPALFKRICTFVI